jgi:hypothetical protein
MSFVGTLHTLILRRFSLIRSCEFYSKRQE